MTHPNSVKWIENADGVNPQIAKPILSSPGAFGVTPWVDHVRGIAGVVFVDNQLSAVNADINDLRAMVNVIAADGKGRRLRPVQPPIPGTQSAAKTTPQSRAAQASRDLHCRQ